MENHFRAVPYSKLNDFGNGEVGWRCSSGQCQQQLQGGIHLNGSIFFLVKFNKQEIHLGHILLLAI